MAHKLEHPRGARHRTDTPSLPRGAPHTELTPSPPCLTPDSLVCFPIRVVCFLFREQAVFGCLEGFSLLSSLTIDVRRHIWLMWITFNIFNFTHIRSIVKVL